MRSFLFYVLLSFIIIKNQEMTMITLTKKDLLKTIKKIIIVLLITFAFYCIIVRFKYPELTETQLFFKVFGLC